MPYFHFKMASCTPTFRKMFYLNLKLPTYLFITSPGEAQPFTSYDILRGLLFLRPDKLKMLNGPITDYKRESHSQYLMVKSKARWYIEQFQREQELFCYVKALAYHFVFSSSFNKDGVWVTEVNFFYDLIWQPFLQYNCSCVFTIFMPLWLYISFISSLPWCCSLFFELNKNTSKETKNVL